MPGFKAVGLSVLRRALTIVAVVAVVVAALFGWMADGPGLRFSDDAAASAGFSCAPYEPVPPSGGVARSVSSQGELEAALAAAEPGDTVNLATGVYRRIDYRRAFGHRSGTAAAPIIIQAAPGAKAVVDVGEGGQPSTQFAVSIQRVAHISVRGLEIRHGIFGALSRGSSSITFEHNDIHRTGQAGVVTGAAEGESGYEPSTSTVVRCNSIHHTGLVQPEFGEGIYVGTGKTGAVDRTSGVVIEGNEIHSISNEAIDVKRYTTDVTIRHNLIHDVTPHYGGAVSLGLNKNDWGPANYLVEHNRIWNVSSGKHYAQAIAVAHGPTVIRHNVIWNIDTKISDSWPWTAAIQVHGDDNDADWAYGFGNPAMTAVQIAGNTVFGCNQGCIDGYTDPGQIRPTLTLDSNLVDRASTGDAANDTDIIVSASDFVGPTAGTADAGSGPGSGFRLRTSPPTSVTTSPTTTSPPTTAAVPSTAAAPTTRARSSTNVATSTTVLPRPTVSIATPVPSRRRSTDKPAASPTSTSRSPVTDPAVPS